MSDLIHRSDVIKLIIKKRDYSNGLSTPREYRELLSELSSIQSVDVEKEIYKMIEEYTSKRILQGQTDG